jgi:hypothetical protein
VRLIVVPTHNYQLPLVWAASAKTLFWTDRSAIYSRALTGN